MIQQLASNPLEMTEERLERMRAQMYFKIEETINSAVPSKRARLGADIDAIVSLAIAIGNAPILHTLQAAAERGFQLAGLELNSPASTPVVPTEKN